MCPLQEPRPSSDWKELTIISPEPYIAQNYYDLIRAGRIKTGLFNASREETASFLQIGIFKVYGFFSLL
jgi:hypothetical protein